MKIWGVVLMEGSHPEQSVKHAAEFVTVDQADLGSPEWADPGKSGGCAAEQEQAAGAVHGFDGIVDVVDGGRVHVLTVVFPVTAAFPKFALQHNGGFGLHVSGGSMLFAPIIQQSIPYIHPLGMEKGHARGFFEKAEQVQGRSPARR